MRCTKAETTKPGYVERKKQEKPLGSLVRELAASSEVPLLIPCPTNITQMMKWEVLDGSNTLRRGRGWQCLRKAGKWVCSGKESCV